MSSSHHAISTTMSSSTISTRSTRTPFKSTRFSNTNSSEPIAVIIGKTFESTTLPDGSQQINEVTKYKRLNDGHVYTESKLRSVSLEEDKENSRPNNGGSIPSQVPGALYGGKAKKKPHRQVVESCTSKPSEYGFKLNPLALNQLACPSSITLTSSSGSMSTEESQQSKPNSLLCGATNCDTSDRTRERGQGIFYCQTKETLGSQTMSVVTEDYEEDSMVEEYLYDNNTTNNNNNTNTNQRKSISPYAAARKENYLEGWCPSFDDLENKSLQLHHHTGVWSSWANDSVFGDNVLMQMFDRSNHQKAQQQGGSTSRNGTSSQGGGTNSNDSGFHLKTSRRGNCTEMFVTTKCRIVVALLVVVVAAVAVIAVAFGPNDSLGWNVNKEEYVEPACIHLEIIIDTDSNTVSTSNPNGDVNEWSLVRHGKVNDSLISIAKSSELSPDTVHNFQHCVKPGVFTFTVSDSGGDGLGTDGQGGYYIVADGVKLGVSSFFFHQDQMTFTLPFEGDEFDGDGDTECADDFFLVIKTDEKPGEITWDVVDNTSGKIVLEGGPYELSNAVYTQRACLKDGNYTFNMRDAGEDGVCCNDGYGLYMLYNDGELIANSDGAYGAGTSTVFLLGSGEE